jgi:glycosyltransferase involved in cell wall biosynthesis
VTKPFPVLHLLSGDLWAGAEVQASHLLEALKRRGHFAPSALLFNEGTLAERLRRSGVDVSVRSEKEGGALALARAASRRIDAGGASLVHSHGYKEDFVAFLATRGGLSLPLLRTQHGSAYPGGAFPYTFYYSLDRFLARRFFRRTIAVSAAVNEELARFLPESKRALVRNGIPIPGGPPPAGPDLPLSPGTRLVASAGRLSPEKRFDRLIDAVALARREIPELRLLLVGDGPERSALESRAAERAGGAVHFAGFREDSTAWIARAEVFVLSSDREGLPISLLEAMALGVPVVATAVGGVPELVRSGETGLLALAPTAEGIAEPLVRLLRDPALRARLGEAGREAVRREYDVERTAEETERLYLEVLAER